MELIKQRRRKRGKEQGEAKEMREYTEALTKRRVG